MPTHATWGCHSVHTLSQPHMTQIVCDVVHARKHYVIYCNLLPQLAQPIRLLLAYVGEEVEEKRYDISGTRMYISTLVYIACRKIKGIESVYKGTEYRSNVTRVTII